MTETKVSKSKYKPINPKALAIRLGVAEPTRSGKGVRIQWAVLLDLWYGWPGTDLSKFAQAHGIKYKSVSKRPEFSARAKIKHNRQGSWNTAFRDRVYAELRIAQVNENDPELLREILRRMMQATSAHTAFIRAKSVKEMSDGTTIANPNMKPTDVRNLAAALKDTSQTLKEIMFLAASIPSAETDDGVKDEPKPVIGKIGAA